MRLLIPHRYPRPLRLAAYALAVAMLAYLCLAPGKDLPPEPLWDKAEHATAWCVLTGVGLLLSPWRPRAIAVFALGFGALIEILQAIMPYGRDGDWRDLAADAVGIALALAAWAAVRRLSSPAA